MIEDKQRLGYRKTNYHIFMGSILTAILFMLGTASFAQERENVADNSLEDFNNTDLNTNQQWEQEEFNTRMIETGLFDAWDKDQDDRLSEQEFEEGYKKGQEQGFTVKEHVIGNYAIVEVNDDDSINLAGPARPTISREQIREWDIDNSNSLSEEEMYEGFFDLWDLDASGALDYEEYNASFLSNQYRN